MIEQPTSFGDWVRRRRKALDLTQEGLAQQVGCAVATIKKIETDERRPSRDMAERLAEYLHIAAEQRETFLRAARNILAVEDLAEPTLALRAPTPRAHAGPPPSPPSPGLRTFLFTDIAGSTRLWEQYPDAMPTALVRHDALVRQAIVRQGGEVFKTVGDAFYSVFPDPLASLLAAQDAQHGLSAERWGPTGPLLVRMAIHTGIAEMRDGDFFGAPLNRVARLLSLAHGGQVLLSAASAELLQDRLPADVRLRDLGLQRLKDLSRPEQVYQSDSADLPHVFPPLRSGMAVPHNLPTPANALIGREVELATIAEHLRHPRLRLLTLLGPGGTGKTRLALQAAREQLDHYPDGVWFVDLAPLRDPAFVVATIARTLGLRESSHQTLEEQVRDYLSERALLLVLDNLEQVIAAAPDLANIMASAPFVRILATSREALRLTGEQIYAVPPLAIAPAGSTDLLSSPATQLFVARARAARSDFVVDSAGAMAIATMCRRLEGLPLAIELAAARVRMLTPQAILERLSRPLDLLTSGARDLPVRQQTLRAAIAWSYDLLSAPEQRMFRQLAVCVGGWELAAADAITRDPQTLDLLSALIDKSLVRQVDTPDGTARYHMLETIREYALEQLEMSGEVEAITERHICFFANLAEQLRIEEFGPQITECLTRLTREFDNLRAALRASLRRKDYEQATRLCTALGWFWWNGNAFDEAWTWIEQLIPHRDTIDPLLWARLLRETDRFFPGTERQFAALNESLAISRQHQDLHGMAWTLTRLCAKHFVIRGNVQAAEPLVQEATTLISVLDEPLLRVELLYLQAFTALASHAYGEAQSTLHAYLRASQALGYQDGIATAYYLLGECAHAQRDYQQAEAYYTQSAVIRQRLGDRRAAAAQYNNASGAALAVGAFDRAAALCHEALQTFASIGWPQGVAWALVRTSELMFAQEQFADSAQVLSAATQLHASLGMRSALQPDDELRTRQLRIKLGEATFTARWASGQALSVDEAIALALGA